MRTFLGKTTPLLVTLGGKLHPTPHLEPRFPDGGAGGLGGFVFFARGGLGRRGHSLKGGVVATLPLWGRLVTLGYFVFWCVGVVCMAHGMARRVAMGR